MGRVTHYYDKIGVAVIKLDKGDLKIGDSIKIVDKAGDELSQKITSMQIEHADIDIAKAKDEFGLKVSSPVKANSEVLKVK